MIRSKPYGAPVLRYLVEVGKGSGLYAHPARMGFTAGQTVWADHDLQFGQHGDAKAFADRHRDYHVVKLRLSAQQEPIRPAKFFEEEAS